MSHGPVERAVEVFEHRLIVVRGGRWRDVSDKRCYTGRRLVAPSPLLGWGAAPCECGGLASLPPVPSFLLGRSSSSGPLRPSELRPSAVYIGICA